MRISSAFGTVVLIPALCLRAPGQNTQSKDPQASEAKGIPPRAAPADYQAQAPAGTVTVAAEFIGHSIPTPDGSTYTTEDYVAVETGLFGPSGARLKISIDNFSLRVYAKKMTSLPSQPFGMVFRSLKDPVWEDSVAVEAKAAKSGNGISTGGKSGKKMTSLPSQPFGMVFRSLKDPVWEDSVAVEAKAAKSGNGISTGGKSGEKEPAAPVHMPLELQRAMQQRGQKTALPEGGRALPQAGLIFFPYRGKVAGIHSIELVYTGPAGTATLTLQP